MLFYIDKNDIAGKYGVRATFITNKLFLAIANSGGKLVSYGSKNIGGSRVLPGPIPPIVSCGSHKVGWIFNVPNISNIPIREIDKSCKTGFILRLQTHPIRFVWRFRIIAFILKLKSGSIIYRFLLWINILCLKSYKSFFLWIGKYLKWFCFLNQHFVSLLLFRHSRSGLRLRLELAFSVGPSCYQLPSTRIGQNILDLKMVTHIMQKTVKSLLLPQK